MAQTYYSMYLKDLYFFTFDQKNNPTGTGTGGLIDNPEMNLYDQIVGTTATRAAFDGVAGGKVLLPGDVLAMDDIAYHASTRITNQGQFNRLGFYFTITLERVDAAYRVEYYRDSVAGENLIMAQNYIAPAGTDVTFDDNLLNTQRPVDYQDGVLQGDKTIRLVEDGINVFQVLYLPEEEEIPVEEIPLDPGTKPTVDEEEILNEEIPLAPNTGDATSTTPAFALMGLAVLGGAVLVWRRK